jgi:hypothetical protein
MPADPDAATAVRRCRARDCPAEVPAEVFMCPQHWSKVPAALRDSLKQTMPSGQEIDDHPSAEFLAFAKAAIAEVAHKEARQRGRTPRTPKKPVQLALF